MPGIRTLEVDPFVCEVCMRSIGGAVVSRVGDLMTTGGFVLFSLLGIIGGIGDTSRDVIIE